VPPDANPPTSSLPPREAEIEVLGKVVRVGLLALRGVLILAAMAATVVGLIGIVHPPSSIIRLGDGGEPMTRAPMFTLLCIGIPPLLPIRWLFGRGRWPMLVVGAILWFLPMWLDGDHEYGWLLRFFATVVALSVLVVWKTIFALTQKHVPPA